MIKKVNVFIFWTFYNKSHECHFCKFSKLFVESQLRYYQNKSLEVWSNYFYQMQVSRFSTYSMVTWIWGTFKVSIETYILHVEIIATCGSYRLYYRQTHHFRPKETSNAYITLDFPITWLYITIFNPNPNDRTQHKRLCRRIVSNESAT